MKQVAAIILSTVMAATGHTASELQSGSDRVEITYVSGDPGAASGMLAVAVKVSGKGLESDLDYFIPFMTVGQAKPHVGQVCQLEWTWFSGGFDWLLASSERVSKGRMVDNFRCEPKRA